MAKIQTKAEKIIEKFVYAHTNRAKVFDERHERNEFYFTDVEGTLSQMTEYQQEFIKDSYNIPISTKLSYPIVEQMISFLTGPKPFPRLVSSSDKTKDFTVTMTKAFFGVWYESKSDEELKKAIRDALVVGSGFIRSRKNNFFEESTFNVVNKQVPWHTVYIDPQSREADFRDAEYMCVAEVMTKDKAQKQYDVKIGNVEGQAYPHNVFVKMPEIEVKEYWAISQNKHKMGDKWVIVLEFFEKVDNNVYISNDGQVSGDKPTPIEIPNPDKLELKSTIESLYNASKEMEDGLKEAEADTSNLQQQDQFTNVDEYNQSTEVQAETGQQSQQMQQQLQELKSQIKQLEVRFAQMPSKVTRYEMKTVKETTAIIETYEMIRKKQIKRTLLVNDKIIEEETLITNRYPIHHIYIDHNGSPNKTYGMIHKIKDMVQAMNKFWSVMLYDVMSNSNRKVLYPEGAIVDVSNVEREWNKPGGAFIPYISDPALPNGGAPMIQEPSPLNQTYPQIIEMLRQLVEYVTGIHGVMQGQASGTSTFGGIQSQQNFGTQRIKLYARNIENALSDLAYSTISHLQHYAPTDKVLTYFDDDNDQNEITILNDWQDIQFKVRVDITNSLPTQKQAAVQMLGHIAQTAQDPHVQKLLTELMLKNMDMPEGEDIQKQISTIENMSQQLEQLQQQLKQAEGTNRALEHNMQQMKASSEIDVAKEKMKGDIKAEGASIKAQMQPQEEEQENDNTQQDEELF